MRNELETTSSSHAKVRTGLVKVLGNTSDDLGKKIEKVMHSDGMLTNSKVCCSFCVMYQRWLKRRQRDYHRKWLLIPKSSKIWRLKYHRSNCLLVTLENSELRKRSIKPKEKSLDAVASAKQLCADVSSVTWEWDILLVKCVELAIEVKCMPGLNCGTKSLWAGMSELERSSRTMIPKVWT